MIEDFKYLSKEKHFRYLPYLCHLFAEDGQTSKRGGGGRYNAILEFKRGSKKMMRKKEKEK
jgi:hypothetical protein